MKASQEENSEKIFDRVGLAREEFIITTYRRRASRADRNAAERSKTRPKRTGSLPHVRDHCRQVSRGYQRYKQEDV